jgi:hypothetical protein
LPVTRPPPLKGACDSPPPHVTRSPPSKAATVQ